MTEQTFTTAQDVKDMIATAIESGGAASADDYDLDLILDATYTFNPETQRFEPTGTEQEFWEAVESSVIDMAADEYHEHKGYQGYSNYSTFQAVVFCENRDLEFLEECQSLTAEELASKFQNEWRAKFNAFADEVDASKVVAAEVYASLHDEEVHGN